MIASAGLFREANQPRYRSLGIGVVGTGRSRRKVKSEILRRTPFYTLRRLLTREDDPQILIIPPLSGHFPIIMRDVVVALLADFSVSLLDWANVRHVRPDEGVFGFDDNIRAVQSAIRLIGRPMSVIALCQGGVPAIAAVADLARDAPEFSPKSLVLIAAPIDPIANPTEVVNLIRRFPPAWYDIVPITRVSPEYEGSGRWVYPAEFQLSGLKLYRDRLIGADSEIARKLAHDDGEDPEHFPFSDLYTSVMDLDATHFAQNIQTVFLRRDLACGTLKFDGRNIDLGLIRNTSLLTVEGAMDDIAAPGQTASAHHLCSDLDKSMHESLVVPDAGHFSTFHGRIWMTKVLPVVRAHCMGI